MAEPAVVVGLGNPLMLDDGIGLELLTGLRAWGSFHPVPVFVDGGTWGMNLLPVIEDAERILFLDAVNAGRTPGAVLRLEGDAIPRWLGVKLSPHQIDLKEVLALVELRGRMPKDLAVVGIQPGRIEMGTGLTGLVRAAVPEAVRLAVRQLEAWGMTAAQAA